MLKYLQRSFFCPSLYYISLVLSVPCPQELLFDIWKHCVYKAKGFPNCFKHTQFSLFVLNLGPDLLGCDSIVLILVPDFIVFLNRFVEVWESCSDPSDSLQPHGLYGSWNFPGQNTGVGSCSLHQVIFPTQGLSSVLPLCRQFFTNWAAREAPIEVWLTCKELYNGMNTIWWMWR